MRYDLIVIGGGIVGLGHAWAAARNGRRVALFESSPQATGASTRNFGMVWPIGQPVGPNRELALRSRQLWLELGQQAGFRVRECGSYFLAHHPDEWQVLQEFASNRASDGLDVELHSRDEVRKRLPAVNSRGLQGALFSGMELGVDPPEAIRLGTAFLAESHAIDFQFACPASKVESGLVTSSDGRVWEADQIVVATGAYAHHLFQNEHRSERLRHCKLQMLAAVPQTTPWTLGPHVASGLTLRHYPSFAECPTLAAVNERICRTMPEIVHFGIHVMASQSTSGELILGDSHEYDAEISPFDKVEIDELILRELNKILDLPPLKFTRRWNGLYAKHPQRMYFVEEVRPDVFIVNGFGGNGMTLALAVAERNILNRFGRSPGGAVFASGNSQADFLAGQVPRCERPVTPQ